MRKNGLVIFPTGIEKSTQIDRWDTVDYSGKPTTKQSVFTDVITTYKLCHKSGETVDLVGFGQGIDSQDKGAGKATTYALKYTLLYTFLVATGYIDDTDNTHSDEVAKATMPTKPAPKAPLVKKAITEAGWNKMLTAIADGQIDAVKKALPMYEFTEEQKSQLKQLIK
jgi:hypothetical protein